MSDSLNPVESVPPSEGARGDCDAFADGRVVADKYLVERTLAAGGLGIVVVARHLALQQRVAIKYLKKQARANRAFVERFEREAQLAAQIKSDHVVRVHDVGTLPGAGPYMVMEYLEGKDLGHVARDGSIPPARAVDYILQACDALAEAHTLGIVHRDLKPENLFLAQRPNQAPTLKIIDFGISKIAPKRRQDGKWANLTEANERFGTPVYMSPEQLRSSTSVDQRADIWALGVVLFELVAGSLPFDGEDVPQLCTSILMKPPARPSDTRPGVPPGLEAAILKCLEKEPRFRFRNVAELAQELAPFGPPDATDRALRVKRTIAQAGQSVRPPTPAMGFGVTLLPNLSPPVLEPADESRTAPTVVLRSRGARARGPWVLAAVALGALFFGVGVVSFVRGSASKGAASGATPPPSALPATEVMTPVPSERTPPPPSVAAAPPSSAKPAAAPQPTILRAAPAAPTSPAAPKGAAPDRRALYGDRK